jgi:hypothetical protein
MLNFVQVQASGPWGLRPGGEGKSATELWRINHRNTWSILRIKLKLLCEQNVEPDPGEIGFAFHRAGTESGQKGAFCTGLTMYGYNISKKEVF